MGANRLASNSLIECLVYGKRAVEDSVRNRREAPVPEITPRFRLDARKLDAYLQLKTEVADIMTREAGIIRNKSGLQEGLNRLEALKAKENFEANEYYSLVSKNLLTVAELIIRSALFREESRGGHFRSDYPNPEDAFVCHIIQQKEKEIRTLPVQLKMTGSVRLESKI